MNEADVCAVIYGPGAEVETAVTAQTVRPRVVTALPAGRHELAAAARAGQARGCQWLWLLDGRAAPCPSALAALLGAVEFAPAPPPLVLASKVIGGDGRLHPDAAPRHEIFEKSHSIDAIERHLVQLRFVTHGSVLVAKEAVERFGLPRSDLPACVDMCEWSLRILRAWDDTGYLVPASVAVRAAPPEPRGVRDWAARLRVLGSPGWRPTERLWETFLLARDAGRALGAAHPGQGRAGVGAPRFSPSRRPRRIAGMARGANRLNRR